jgi:hypothetical protein
VKRAEPEAPAPRPRPVHPGPMPDDLIGETL